MATQNILNNQSTPFTVSTLYTNTPATNLTVSANTIAGSGSDASVDVNINPKLNGTVKITTTSTGGMWFRGVTSGYTTTEWHTKQAAVQTSDATPTAIITIPLTNSLMVSIKALVNGFQSTYADCVGGEIMVTAYRKAAGDIILVGSPIINVNYTNLTDTSDVDAVIDVGTESIIIKVIGVAATTWNWVASYNYMYTVDNS